MKEGLHEIVGKTIHSVITANNDREPRIQVFLVFSDGTYFEFYGAAFTCTSALSQGGLAAAERYAGLAGGTVRTWPQP